MQLMEQRIESKQTTATERLQQKIEGLEMHLTSTWRSCAVKGMGGWVDGRVDPPMTLRLPLQPEYRAQDVPGVGLGADCAARPHNERAQNGWMEPCKEGKGEVGVVVSYLRLWSSPGAVRLCLAAEAEAEAGRNPCASRPCRAG